MPSTDPSTPISRGNSAAAGPTTATMEGVIGIFNAGQGNFAENRLYRILRVK